MKVICFTVFVLAAVCSYGQQPSSAATDSLTAAAAIDSSQVIAVPQARAENDGTSFEKAVIIDKESESEGIAEEYKWVKLHYTGAKMIQQVTTQKGGKQYDILTIKTTVGKKLELYFDITQFYGKF